MCIYVVSDALELNGVLTIFAYPTQQHEGGQKVVFHSFFTFDYFSSFYLDLVLVLFPITFLMEKIHSNT
jgi:hypothetical protein